jgi:CheY-like chemotaxis protein
MDMETNKVNILVVDDDKNTRVYVAKLLSVKDWQVDTAPDGPAALELVRAKKYDAAVLDYRLPGMNGAELCKKIREKEPDMPAVFLTGYARIDTVFPAIEAGADRVLAKPVDPAELINVLEEELQSAAAGRNR